MKPSKPCKGGFAENKLKNKLFRTTKNKLQALKKRQKVFKMTTDINVMQRKIQNKIINCWFSRMHISIFKITKNVFTECSVTCISNPEFYVKQCLYLFHDMMTSKWNDSSVLSNDDITKNWQRMKKQSNHSCETIFLKKIQECFLTFFFAFFIFSVVFR